MTRYIIIDDQNEIYLEGSDSPLKDENKCREIFRNLFIQSFCLKTKINDEDFLVESFDSPLIALRVVANKDKLIIQTKLDLYFETDLNGWCTDFQDDFHGSTIQGVPFRLSKKAQMKLFNECDSFDDNSFTLSGIKVLTKNYYEDGAALTKSEYWNNIYNQPENPGWDLNQPAEAFKDMLPRIKLPKSRILVLGCGYGHDAALFAQAGHVVTAVDFSNTAILEAQKKYSHFQNLNFERRDVFDLPHEWNNCFDVVVEHTLFCAINPEKRPNLVRVWKRLLHEEGQLMGVFFTMLKRYGPPYGATEQELRSLLMPHFQFLFWGRLRNSLPERLGKELFVLAKKR